MPSFDGIRRGPTPPSRPPLPLQPAQRERPRAGRPMPRNAGFVVASIVLVTVFALLRPDSEASSIPASPETTAADIGAETSLPPQLANPLTGADDRSLDEFVILDQPTDSSRPQPEEGSEADVTVDTTGDTSTSEPEAEPSAESKDFTIRILNGGGKAGAAAALRTELAKQSLTVSSVGNAQQTYTESLIYYQAGKRAEAELTAKALGEPAVILEENAIAAPADLLIVIGTDRK